MEGGAGAGEGRAVLPQIPAGVAGRNPGQPGVEPGDEVGGVEHRHADRGGDLVAIRRHVGALEQHRAEIEAIAMRALAWPDALPATDIGVMNALGTRDAKAVAERAEAWRPWRSYAVMKLWQSLETGT